MLARRIQDRGDVLRVVDAEDLHARIVPRYQAGKATEAKCNFRWRSGG